MKAMDRHDIHSVFDALTEKQDEALRLACQHLTSKQIAQQLNVAPVTIDKRIDAVRAKLGHMPRIDVLRHYRAWAEGYGRTIDDPTILATPRKDEARRSRQPRESSYVFEDSFAFDTRASWDRNSRWLPPRIRPSDLGVGSRLLLILAGAVAIMIVAVLSMAFAHALGTML